MLADLLWIETVLRERHEPASFVRVHVSMGFSTCVHTSAHVCIHMGGGVCSN